MSAIPVIAVFDVGKTNKKLFLFDEDYKIVYQQAHKFPEITDEDGDPCENLAALTEWTLKSLGEILHSAEFDVKAINFSSYGASFVHLDDGGNPILPLYNYLKPYPASLKQQFFNHYGGEKKLSRETASPVLDSLNSGLQLYRLKYEKALLDQPGYSLHLPQYLSYLVTGKLYSDITSIGCHTMLWDFNTGDYHRWVAEERISQRLPPILAGDHVVISEAYGKKFLAGGGLHDSSSALIPYLSAFHHPFVLISTGTWCISLNPFNSDPLTDRELSQDCLSFLSFQRKPVKASRLFAGYEHEQQIKVLARHFRESENHFESVHFDPSIVERLTRNQVQDSRVEFKPGASLFSTRNLDDFDSYEIAYHQFIMDIIHKQTLSTKLVIGGEGVKRIFVDGGFSKNPVYMNLLAISFPDVEVYAASVAQATAIGAALAIHQQWNKRSLPADLIELRYYARPA